MRAIGGKVFWALAAAVSAIWLAGYVRSIWSEAVNEIPEGRWSFLAYPHIKLYRIRDQATGEMSKQQIDWFNMADGPTGIEYAEANFPCWTVSIAAIGVLAAATYSLLSGGDKSTQMPRHPSKSTGSGEVDSNPC